MVDKKSTKQQPSNTPTEAKQEKQAKKKKTPKRRQKSNLIIRNVDIEGGSIRTKREANEGGVLTDQFILEDSVQLLSMTDNTQYTLQAAAMMTHEQYTKLAGDTETSKGIYSLSWREPGIHSDSASTTVTDKRGILVQLKGVTVNFRNVSKGDIWLRHTVPRAKSDTPEDISHRTNIGTLNLRPNQKYVVGYSFNNTANDSPHVTVRRDADNDDSLANYARLLDFLPCYSDINPETGASFDPKAEMLKVSVSVTYTVDQSQTGQIKDFSNKIFALLNLKTPENMFYVDQAVHGPFSGHSKRNLYGQGYIIAAGVGAGTSNTGLVALIATDGVATNTVSPAFVSGQTEGDFICLPFGISIQGVTYNVARFTKGTFTFKSTELKDLWILQENLAMVGTANLSTAVTYVIPSTLVRSPLVVQYVTSESQKGVPPSQKSKRSAIMAPVRRQHARSFIAFITFLTATVELLQILTTAAKGVNRVLSKKTSK